MCKVPLYFTDHPERRRGGIVVCGLNWGVDEKHPQKLDEVHVAGWTPSAFYQPDDPFREAMAKWFATWGRDPQLDTELDSALLATNVFYNTTHGSGPLRDNATPDNWRDAVRRLLLGAREQVDASALLVATRLSAGHIGSVLSSMVPGFCWEQPLHGWSFGSLGEMSIAVGPHYRARRGLASNAAVMAAGHTMGAWIDRAMQRFRRIQGR